MKLVLPDLRAGGRRNNYIALLGPWSPLIIFAVLVATLFTVVTKLGDGVSSGYDKDARFYCDPNGNIQSQLPLNTYSRRSPYWNGDLFFTVTMGFHGLSFAQARAIDLCFDAIVGRGSQVLVALATYPIFRRAVLRSMEIRELSLALLIPFFVERVSFYTVWSLIWNMRSVRQKQPESDAQVRSHKIRVDWRIVLIILVSCYILALPTLLAAMTSYQARSAPFIPTNGGNQYVSTEELDIPNYVIRNGDLVGLSKDYPVFNESDGDLAVSVAEYSSGFDDAYDLWTNTWTPFLNLTRRSPSTGLENSSLKELEAKYDKFIGSLPTKLEVKDQKNRPPLWTYKMWPGNVTIPVEYWNGNVPTLSSGTSLQSSILLRNKTYDIDSALGIYDNNRGRDGFPDDSSANITYANGRDTWDYYSVNTIYAIGRDTIYPDEIAEIGVCLPSNGYTWGFSSIMLFTFCMLTIVIGIFLIALHIDAYCNSSADRYKLYISPYRDILDLAAEIRAHYGATEVDTMPAKALDKAMGEDPAVTRLDTELLHASRMAKWWQQANGSSRVPSWYNLRKRSAVVRSDPVDAEESLMSMGFEAKGPEIEMGKVPAKVMTRGSSNSGT